jgi:hypothetical protein
VPIPPRLLRALLIRGAILWALARVSVIVVFAMAEISPIQLLAFWSVLATSGLLLVDLNRRQELILLHNLGMTTLSAVLVGCSPALVLEAVLVAVP